MSNTPDDKQNSLNDAWNDDSSDNNALFHPDDIDIFANKVTNEVWFFHSKPLEVTITSIEYDASDRSITLTLQNGDKMDLGVKAQDLIAPRIEKTAYVTFVKTKDQKAEDGVKVPLNVINRENSENTE